MVKLLSLSDLFVPYIGGGVTSLFNIETRLVKMGHDVHHVTLRLEHTPRYEVFHGIRIHRCDMPFTKNSLQARYLFPFASYGKAVRLARDMDIVQATTFPAAISGWKVGRDSEKPSVLLAHEFFRDLWKKLGQNPVQKHFFPLVEKYIASRPYSHFVAISEYTKSMLLKFGVPKEKITVIYGAVDGIFNPKADGTVLRRRFKLQGKKVFGFTGRLAVSPKA